MIGMMKCIFVLDLIVDLFCVLAGGIAQIA